MVKIGNLALGDKPRIAAIIDEMIPAEEITALEQMGVDLLEMRIDCYRNPLPEIVTYLDEIRSITKLPMIGTVRETDENRSVRERIFQEIIPFVNCVDLEFGTPIVEKIVPFCKNVTVMISEHDFEKTPSEDQLREIAERARNQGAHIVKIAVMANTTCDVRRLLKFTDNCQSPLVTISMGACGTITRVMAPLFGSLFTYGYLKKPVAPGQLSVKKLLEEVRLYYPESAV